MVYDPALGQKKFTVIGIPTLTVSPSNSTSCSSSISGEILVISCLKCKESFDNIFSTKLLIVDVESSPFTDIIKCLNRVVNSGEICVPNLLTLLSSSSIALSSLPVSILKLIFQELYPLIKFQNI